MPTDEDMWAVLQACPDFWDRNPNTREVSASRRSFHRERNYALLLLMLDTTARIGELLSLSVEDYREGGGHPRSQGEETQEDPGLPGYRRGAGRLAAGAGLAAKDVPLKDREDWLFLGETATRIMERS